MDNQPTQQDITRQIRHAGFNNSTVHLPQEARQNLYEKYSQQDARREKNISGFMEAIRVGK